MNNIATPVLRHANPALMRQLDMTSALANLSFDRLMALGFEAKNDGRLSVARKWWHIAAQRVEHPQVSDAMFNYAWACENDSDARINPYLQSETYTYYIKAIEHDNHAGASNNLGFLFLKGKFVKKDLYAALVHFGHSADAGDVHAMYNLATELLKSGAERNIKKAHRLLVQVANLGARRDSNGDVIAETIHMNAMHQLAAHYSRGTFDKLSGLINSKELATWRQDKATVYEVMGAEAKHAPSVLNLADRLRDSDQPEQVHAAQTCYRWVLAVHPELGYAHLAKLGRDGKHLSVVSDRTQDEVLPSGKSSKLVGLAVVTRQEEKPICFFSKEAWAHISVMRGNREPELPVRRCDHSSVPLRAKILAPVL